MNDRAKRQIAELSLTKRSYEEFILCNQADPYKTLMQNKIIKAIPGVVGSNLIAQVKIKNSGKKAIRYRQIANRILFDDIDLQTRICQIFSQKYATIIFYKEKNPTLVLHDGTKDKAVWHHSPNHILTVSLIPEDIHLKYKKFLHIEGKKGGNAMYSV